MSKQLKDTPCVGCKFFRSEGEGRPVCRNENMCNDFSCYREQRLSHGELVALLSEGVNLVRMHPLGRYYVGPWVTKASEALDRE